MVDKAFLRGLLCRLPWRGPSELPPRCAVWASPAGRSSPTASGRRPTSTTSLPPGTTVGAACSADHNCSCMHPPVWRRPGPLSSAGAASNGKSSPSRRQRRFDPAQEIGRPPSLPWHAIITCFKPHALPRRASVSGGRITKTAVGAQASWLSAAQNERGKQREARDKTLPIFQFHVPSRARLHTTRLLQRAIAVTPATISSEPLPSRLPSHFVSLSVQRCL